MMNRDKLMGAIGSSLIGVGTAIILYAVNQIKKGDPDEVVQDAVDVEEEEQQTTENEEVAEEPAE